MNLKDVKIVLSRVSESGNAGAVCRVMKNMGLFDLRLAAPYPLNIDEIQARSVHAFDIWENARTYDNLGEAVKDCSIVVGTTRRRGQNRKSVSMPPDVLASWLAERPGPAAIVFGNERTGLEDAELDLCNFASHIPVSEAFPSLNLSHAVQIYAYELFLALETQLPVKGEWQAMSQAEINEVTASIADNLESLGFYKQAGKEEQVRFFKDIISRAGLANSEGRYLKGIFEKAAQLAKKR